MAGTKKGTYGLLNSIILMPISEKTLPTLDNVITIRKNRCISHLEYGMKLS